MSYAKAGILMGLLATLCVWVGYGISQMEGGLFGLALGALVNAWLWCRAGDAMLAAYGAREVDEASDPDLVGLLRATAARADLPAPRLYLIDCEQPNAFAVGTTPDSASIALSTGLLEHLSDEELVAVIGHELGHIRARDPLVMIIAATMVGAVLAVGALLAVVGWAERRKGAWALLVLGFTVSLGAILLKLAISREQ